jgi:DegV family protein with EDD domain
VTTAIVVDSAAALPGELVARHAIEVVPMVVVIDGRPRPETEVATDELLAELAHGSVSTTGPNPGAWTAAIERALARADEVVVLTVSAEMSSTYSAATIGASTAGPSVHVVDTRSAAGGEGLVTLAAARVAEQGAGAAEIVRWLPTVIDRVHLVATLPNLDHLVRSGRVANLTGSAAHAMRVNPMFEFRDGAARALHPALGQRAALGRIVHSCLASKPRDVPAPKLHVAALEAACPQRARALLHAVVAEVPDADAFIASFGSVMLVHVGPGLVGMAWWWET